MIGVDVIPGLTEAEVERFWASLVKTETCWLYPSRSGRIGYAQHTIRGLASAGGGSVIQRSWSAHRIAWQIARGPIPGGAFVCHHCDVPNCARPEHLFLGTAKENSRDWIIKGGPDHNNPRPAFVLAYTRDQVDAIRMAAGWDADATAWATAELLRLAESRAAQRRAERGAR